MRIWHLRKKRRGKATLGMLLQPIFFSPTLPFGPRTRSQRSTDRWDFRREMHKDKRRMMTKAFYNGRMDISAMSKKMDRSNNWTLGSGVHSGVCESQPLPKHKVDVFVVIIVVVAIIIVVRLILGWVIMWPTNVLFSWILLIAFDQIRRINRHCSSSSSSSSWEFRWRSSLSSSWLWWREYRAGW